MVHKFNCHTLDSKDKIPGCSCFFGANLNNSEIRCSSYDISDLKFFFFLVYWLFTTLNIFYWQVFTWGHRLVTPRRVVVARNIRKLGNTPLKFHRKERLHVGAIAAGVTHSMALTGDGTLFYWVSSDPSLRCQQV